MTSEDDAEVGEWITVAQAAAEIGVSPSGFRVLARREGINVRRRGPRPGVNKTSLYAYIERARIVPPTSSRPALEEPWLPLEDAATLVGLSTTAFRILARYQGYAVNHPDGTPGVTRTDVEAFLQRARVQPGTILGQSKTRRSRLT